MAANCLVFSALNTMSITNEWNAEQLFATSSHTRVWLKGGDIWSIPEWNVKGE